MSTPQIHFAPMQGYVDNAYRKLHAEIFGGIDCYYTPFIRVEKGQPRRQDISRLTTALTDGTQLVPQVIFGSIAEFTLLTTALKELGISQIDLNLGCPFAMQTNKGRGAAMINNTEVMRQVAHHIKADTGVKYSIKMRLGMQQPNEWRNLMPILNDMPLQHITLHPHVAKQMYEGLLHTGQVAPFISESVNPVIYNGDISTTDDIKQVLEAHPQLSAIMIGRGLLGRPSLAAEYKSGNYLSEPQLLEMIYTMHNALLQQYEATLCGQTQILQKIKPFWQYLEPLIGHRKAKALRKATTLDKYRQLL